MHVLKTYYNRDNKVKMITLVWECTENGRKLNSQKGIIQSESLASGPKLLSMYTVEQRRFLVCKYWQTGSFKACQTAFQTEFGERRAPSEYCIQKLVKKLETRGSQSNACRLLSLGPIEG